MPLSANRTLSRPRSTSATGHKTAIRPTVVRFLRARVAPDMRKTPSRPRATPCVSPRLQKEIANPPNQVGPLARQRRLSRKKRRREPLQLPLRTAAIATLTQWRPGCRSCLDQRSFQEQCRPLERYFDWPCKMLSYELGNAVMWAIQEPHRQQAYHDNDVPYVNARYEQSAVANRSPRGAIVVTHVSSRVSHISSVGNFILGS